MLEETPTSVRSISGRFGRKRAPRCDIFVAIVGFFGTTVTILAGTLLVLYVVEPVDGYQTISWICVISICVLMVGFVACIVIFAGLSEASRPKRLDRSQTYGQVLAAQRGQTGFLQVEPKPRADDDVLRGAAQDTGPGIQTLQHQTPPTEEEARRMKPEAESKPIEVPLPPGTPDKIEATAEIVQATGVVEEKSSEKERTKEALQDAPSDAPMGMTHMRSALIMPQSRADAAGESRAMDSAATGTSEAAGAAIDKAAIDKGVTDKPAAAEDVVEKVEVMEAGDSEDEDEGATAGPAPASATIAEQGEFDKTLDDILNIDDEEEEC